MKRVFHDFGAMIVTVIAVVALIGLTVFLMRPGSVMANAFSTITGQFVDASDEMIEMIDKDLTAPSLNLNQTLSEDSDNPTAFESASLTLSGTATDDSGVASLTVNGTEVTVGEDGSWSTTVTLTQNATKEIAIVATDAKGNATEHVGYAVYREYTSFTVTQSNRGKIGYTSSTTDLVIPEIFYDEEDGVWCKVVGIEAASSYTTGAFYNCDSLESVEIPASVTSIGNYAFNNCSSLKHVTFGDNSQLTSIGRYAFHVCISLESVIFGDNSSLTQLDSYAFNDCTSLESVTFGDNSQLTRLYHHVFEDCTSLAIIDIPSSVTYIGDAAFYNCTSLARIVFGDDSQLTEIGMYAFQSCKSLTRIEIPDRVNYITFGAFRYCTNLTSVTFENTDGWYVKTSYTATDKTSLTLTNVSANAAYLKSTYCLYYWFRS